MLSNDGIRAAAAQDDADGPTRPFDQSLPMMLMRAREGVMRRFRPHLRGHGLTDQQWRILRGALQRRTASSCSSSPTAA